LLPLPVATPSPLTNLLYHHSKDQHWLLSASKQMFVNEQKLDAEDSQQSRQ